MSDFNSLWGNPGMITFTPYTAAEKQAMTTPQPTDHPDPLSPKEIASWRSLLAQADEKRMAETARAEVAEKALLGAMSSNEALARDNARLRERLLSEDGAIEKRSVVTRLRIEQASSRALFLNSLDRGAWWTVLAWVELACRAELEADLSKALTAEVHRLREDAYLDMERADRYAARVNELELAAADISKAMLAKDAELAKMEVRLSEADREWRLRADLQVNDGARLTDLAAKLATAESRASSAEAELSALRKSMEALARAYDHDGPSGDRAVAREGLTADEAFAVISTGGRVRDREGDDWLMSDGVPHWNDGDGYWMYSSKDTMQDNAPFTIISVNELEAALGTRKEGR